MEFGLQDRKLHLMTWLLIPVLLMWISVTYLIGLTRGVVWMGQPNGDTKPSEALVSSMMTEPVTIPPVTFSDEPLVTFWFDDAWETQFSVAYPILEEKGYEGTLAVPTRLVEYDGYMTWLQVRQVQYKGWEITAHSKHHICDRGKYSIPTFVRDELVGALDDFAVHGITPTHFVTPCGIENAAIYETAQQHYASLRGTKGGMNALPVTNTYDLRVREVNNRTTRADIDRWIAEADKEDAWLIFMFHQIKKNPGYFDTTPELLQYITNRVAAARIQVVLPSQVIDVQEGGE